MQVMVVSDTHGNLDNLRRAVNEVLSRHEIDLFVHLGDDYEDAEVFDEYACEYLRVPGVYDDRYRDRAIPNRIIKDFLGWRVLMSHTDGSHSNDLPEDLRPGDLIKQGQVDVLLYGHSHRPAARLRDGVLLVNPGHLKGEDKKGFPLTYAVISISQEAVTAAIRVLGSKKNLEQAVVHRA